MGTAILKRFLNRTNLTFLCAPLIGIVTVVPGAGIEFIAEFAVIANQPVVAILDGNDTGYPLKEGLIFFSLPIKFLLFFADLAGHFVNRR